MASRTVSSWCARKSLTIVDSTNKESDCEAAMNSTVTTSSLELLVKYSCCKATMFYNRSWLLGFLARFFKKTMWGVF